MSAETAKTQKIQDQLVAKEQELIVKNDELQSKNNQIANLETMLQESNNNKNDSGIPTDVITTQKITHDADSVASQIFSEPTESDRPTNVYLEKIKGIDVVWYNTEAGNEIGRKAIVTRNEKTKSDVQVGYDYTINATAKAIQSIKEKSFPGTAYYKKDNGIREAVSEKKFIV